MKIWVSIIAALMFAGLPHMPPMPPVEYTGPTYREIKVSFKDPIAVHIACGGNIVEYANGNHQIFACAGVNKNWMIVPDPCAHPDESYARLICHELGHNKGWPTDHPNPVEYKPVKGKSDGTIQESNPS